jgi:hypothetical protein
MKTMLHSLHDVPVMSCRPCLLRAGQANSEPGQLCGIAYYAIQLPIHETATAACTCMRGWGLTYLTPPPPPWASEGKTCPLSMQIEIERKEGDMC